ncbi:MAG: Methionyl-tRNA formyltransferase [Candidatus Wolfebacteria bacterium GW2011_GWC1_43_10]|uniref:methionyl-tRNA formyltransferase n=2 Tax=Candidatus Wolfeibacteriota TaxID=1752735 RepID=A0A0G1F5W1_9BACT|nr:MAG: Methionyl-tRNA formyltransferase [Candidatus Wolfebacteria bacterium GW2011_GWC1_43_10]KKT22588.1 MAG: Methionyl-tRNA formyltransferase [Parcubacteria group bacterium GW2011_GWB1_43_8b]OGM89853.1 MAG: methionyl-tRNA formyltransferase [Candidatus Wolfebacteria bacterium GWA1_42_9]
MKLTFFGSSNFSKIVLEIIIKNEYIPSVLICNPDKLVGRKQIITPPPTKQFILENSKETKVLQPLKKQNLVDLALSGEFNGSEFAIVAAYSKIIPKEVLDIFPKGVIGVHPSLLPKYRGASPIQSMILEGEENIGLTLYLMDEGMDSGDVIANSKLKTQNLRPTYKELEKELAELGGKMLVEILPDFMEEKIKTTEQDNSQATFTKKFITEDGLVDLQKDSPTLIERKIRALNPDPGVYAFIDGKRVKFLEARVEEDGKVIITKILPEGKTERSVNIILPLT